jgi:glycosyltransferase EpsD
LVKNNHYNVIHVHTPIASFLTRLASKGLKGTKIIYTAHGFHFFKGSYLLCLVIYYPIVKYLSKYTDLLITMNEEDYDRSFKFKAKAKAKTKVKTKTKTNKLLNGIQKSNECFKKMSK